MLKESLKLFKNKELRIFIIIIVFSIFLVLVKFVLKDTHAFYNSETNPIPIFNTKVGDFTGEGESVKDGPLTGIYQF